MTLASLLVKIGADVTGFVSGVGKAANKVAMFGNMVRSTGMKVYSAGRTMTTHLTLPLLGLGYAIIKTGSDFESAFASVKKTVSASRAGFAVLRQGIRDMAKEIPQTAVQIAEIMAMAGQLGIKNRNLLSFTRIMADLGVATNLTGDAAAILSARFGNITELPERQFDRFGSTLVHLGNNLATTEREVLEMGLRIAGAGEQVGMTEKEILGMAGALSSLGVKVESGGSAASRILIYMNKIVSEGGEKLALMADTAGMTGQAFQNAFKRDASTALVAFIEGLGKIQDKGGNVFKLLEDLGYNEIRLRDATLRLANGGDQLRKSLKLADDAWKKNNALTKEANRRYKTLDSRWEVFKNKIKDVAITLYDALRPAIIGALEDLEPFINKLADMADKFSKLSPAMQKNIVKWIGLVAVMGPALVIMGLFLRTIGSAITGFVMIAKGIGKVITMVIWLGRMIIGLPGLIARAFSAIAAAASGLVSFLAANPIVLAIAAAIAAAVLIIFHWDKVKAFLGMVWDWIFSAGKAIFNAHKAVVLAIWGAIYTGIVAIWSGIVAAWDAIWESQLGSAIVATLQHFKNIIVTYVNAHVAVFRVAWRIISFIVRGALNFITAYIRIHMTILKTLFTMAWQIITTVFRVAWRIISTVVMAGLNIIRTYIQVHMAVIRTIFSVAWAVVRNIFVTSWNIIKTVVQTGMAIISGIIRAALAILRGDWSAAWSAIKAILDAAWAGIKAAVAIGIQTIVTFFWELPGRIISAIGDLGSLLYNKGRELIGGFIRGIVDAAKAIPGIVAGAVGSAGSSGIGGLIEEHGGQVADPRVISPKVLVPAEKMMANQVNALEKTLASSAAALPNALARHNAALTAKLRAQHGTVNIKAKDHGDKISPRRPGDDDDGKPPYQGPEHVHFHGDTMTDPKKAIRELTWYGRRAPFSGRR